MKLLKKSAYLLLGILLIASVASCTTFKLSGIQITREIPSYQPVGEFEITIPVTELLGSSGGANIANVSATAMDEKIYDAIQREIQKFTGDAAVNVTVEYQVTLMNAVLNGLTASILAPATAKVTGVIVKYQ
jgi:hypothetical protein